MTKLTLVIVIALNVVILLVPLAFLVRLVACVVSPSIRQRVRRRPVIHVVWGLVSLLILFVKCFPRMPNHESSVQISRVRANTLALATKQFFLEYKRFPLQTKSCDHIYSTDYEDMVSVLCRPQSNRKENPRQIWFFDISDMSSDDRNYTLLDAWGRPFYVMCDWDNDNCLLIGTNTVHEIVAVWSSGKNGSNEYGAGDDLTSWK